MKISTKGEYGIRAMLELALHQNEGYVQSTLIATSRKIPENYLYQLLITLRKAGLIRSRRGPQGGHMLARPAAQINLTEVIIALEGPIAPVACVQAGIVEDCPFFERCVVKDVWVEVTEATQRILDGTSFQDLLDREQKLAQDLAAK